MRGRLVPVLVGAALVAAAMAVAPVPTLATSHACDPTTEVADPAPFEWTKVDDHYVGVLEYGEATFSIAGETLTTRAYRQEGECFSIPGPTMHMTPGNRYVVRFRNLLDYEPPSGVHNDFKDPNVTNLHTHGLHISGESPADDVTRMFEGGYGGDYVYDIPADHMGGTYWYHAHHHGSTFLQVSTGGFGLIVIDDGADKIPSNVAAMAERQVLIGYLDTGAAGTGGDQLVSGTLPAGWTVNGTVGGTITMPPDTWQHWRVLLADRDARMKTVSLSSGCEAELLARDGVWRTVAPKHLPTNEVALTGASRADLAVRCTGDAELRVDGRTVATVAVDGTADSDPHPHPYGTDGGPWSATRPDYLRELRAVGSVNSESISMGARTVNGGKFDIETPTFTLEANAVQEWTIRGATNHPFHLHVYHFQPTRSCGDFEAGEYYDTIASNCTVRFDLSPATSYEGMTIMHCHILSHEDQGAMTWMDVIGGTPPPEYPDGHGYGEYYPLDDEPPPPPTTPPAAPSGLTATATTASSVDLTWVDNATDETWFAVERSTDGTSFGWVAEVGFDVTSWTDTDVNAETAYWYRVAAGNAAGASDWSATATVTTPSDAGGDLQASVSVGTVNLGKGLKAGQATVTVLAPDGSPAAGAVVDGAFQGTFGDVVSATTGPAGTVTFTTVGSAKGSVSVTFCVADVRHPGGTWSGEVCASG